ncbi:xaa-Pro aminopeptidase 3 [Nerophis lumbriciformis]|uniref:xaa-Pro aminopeptidase 3 n=1 Tax=Nerophis lumbriciformis TaxID=546530 RepID=UPI002AE00748|nr:xaa-Pro aminopeptidase 3-like [Nerophis lumbriciformis]XP_061830488.1 xaa-Pro aminopeptidase 3-like [Nerophis lumbriciformis]XP_061830489.1 xaa-Pro aminopeptidase 3-like [Nerophis lumbriciformis]
MVTSAGRLLRAAAKLLSATRWSPGCVWCPCRNISVKPGGLHPKTVPARYLGQPSPFTHPHLLKHGEVTPGLSQAEYELRRHRLASLVEAQWDRLASDSSHVLLVLSHPTRYMTNDIPYPFHQNQDFLYLCGILEPDSALVLYGKGQPDKAILFVPRRDPGRELWDGPRSGKDGAAALTGIERVHSTEELGLVLRSIKGSTLWYDSSSPSHPGLHQAHISPLLEAGPMPRPLRPLIHSLRALKSSSEVALMQAAGRITAQAFRRTMAVSLGDVDESLLYAKFDFENRLHGANFLAYPPVVAGGNRANTLHYINNNQMIKDGEMVLLDGGCEYFGYVSDVTRTWPVNGQFSAAQAELYEAVLEVQLSCLSLCSPGVSLDHIYSTMLALLGRQLRRLGIVKAGSSDADALKAARHYCPHHVGHYLGMDVHDTPELSRSQPLQSGMTITIEPGLYIGEDNEQVPERFRGMGIRIEDDVLIRDKGGPLILSSDAPKTIAEVQLACAQR